MALNKVEKVRRGFQHGSGALDQGNDAAGAHGGGCGGCAFGGAAAYVVDAADYGGALCQGGPLPVPHVEHPDGKDERHRLQGQQFECHRSLVPGRQWNCRFGRASNCNQHLRRDAEPGSSPWR